MGNFNTILPRSNSRSSLIFPSNSVKPSTNHNNEKIFRISKIPNNNFNNSAANFLSIYFDFGYFIFCSPFRLVRDNSHNTNGAFSIRKNIIQNVLCAVFNCLGIYSMFCDLRGLYPSIGREDASAMKYFELLGYAFTYTFQLLTLKKFWFEQNRILEIVNFLTWIERRVMMGTLKMKIQHKNFCRLLCAIFVVMSLYEVTWKRVFAPYPTWNVTIWNRKLVSYGRYMVFMVNDTEKYKRPELDEISNFDCFLAIIAGITIVESYVLGFYPDLILLLCVLTTWTVAYQLAHQLKSDLKISTYKINWLANISREKGNLILKYPGKDPKFRSLKWVEIYCVYQSIRELYEMISITFGGMFTIYLANSLLFHATGMDEVLVATNIPYQVRLLFFIVTSSCMFILAADTSNQLDALKYWLRRDENRKNIPPDQLNVVLGEIKAREIGIRGNNIFTITYPLMWNMMTTVVTYFIICLQARQQNHQKDLQSKLVSENCTNI